MDTPIRRGLRAPLTESREKAHSTAKSASSTAPKKQIPPDQTHAENFYYLKQMQTKTTMVVVLTDGETLRGVIEWYDRSSLKIHRDDAPNILLMKDTVKYMYKENEDKEQDGD